MGNSRGPLSARGAEPSGGFPRDPRVFIRDPVPTECELAAGSGVLEVPRLGVFLIGGYDALVEAARNTAIFRSDLRSLDDQEALRGQDIPRLLRSDGENHLRVRQMVERAAGLADGETWSQSLHQRLQHLLGQVSAGRVLDLAPVFKDFSYGMIIDLIGFTPGSTAQHRQLIAWFEAIELLFSHSASRQRLASASAQLPSFYAFLERQLAHQRAAPTATLLGRLCQVSPALSDWEITGIVRQIMASGANTVRSQLLNLMLLLIDHPVLWERLKEDPAQVGSLVWEGLRLNSAVGGMWRRTGQAVCLGGHEIPRDTLVQMRFRAAGFDPSRFPDPTAVRLDRGGRPAHLAFGYGIHNCMGRSLALAQMRAVISAMTQRFGGIRLAIPRDRIQWINDISLRGPLALPVMLSP